jgi:hypothetical protein
MVKKVRRDVRITLPQTKQNGFRGGGFNSLSRPVPVFRTVEPSSGCSRRLGRSLLVFEERNPRRRERWTVAEGFLVVWSERVMRRELRHALIPGCRISGASFCVEFR